MTAAATQARGARTALAALLLVLALLQMNGDDGMGGGSRASRGLANLQAGASSASAAASSGAALHLRALAVPPGSPDAGGPSFNVIITTARGNASALARMLASIAPQLTARDHLTILSDGGHEVARAALRAAPCACTRTLYVNPTPLGFWGHGSRTKWQGSLPGDFHMNADDDDVYAPSAMDVVRWHVAAGGPPTLYIFHMIRRSREGVVQLHPPRGLDPWETMDNGAGVSVLTNPMGTPCGVYPKLPNLPPWQPRYGGDGEFYVALKEMMEEVVLVPEVIYQVGQGEDLLALAGGLSVGHTLAARRANGSIVTPGNEWEHMRSPEELQAIRDKAEEELRERVRREQMGY
jgi:hypothetical protein